MHKVPAVTRAVAILRLLGKSEEPMGVNAIARAIGIIPSTALYILRALAAEGLVGFDPATKRYALDAGILTLARSMLRPTSFIRIVQPALDHLSAAYPVTAVAVRVLGLDHIVVIGIAGSQLNGRIHVEVGSRFPALISATGRCMAAFGGYSSDEIEQHFAKVRWDDPPTLKAWKADVEAARRNGYSADIGHYISGITVIAAPVLDLSGCMSHAVALVGVSQQLRRTTIPAIGKELRAISEQTAARMRDATLQ